MAPAGPIESRDSLKTGIATLTNMEFKVSFDDRIFETSGYLAGDDCSRAEELMRAFENPQVRAVIGLRGGYGCARLIPLLSEKRLRPCPKVFMGFSDLTTLHLYFRRRLGWITFHGPMACTIGSATEDQKKHIISLWTDPDYRPAFTFPQLETWVTGAAEGVLVGGCLSLVTASIGTPYEIETEGKILFLEDQGEPPYRLDRMLTHLKLAGKLERIAGLLLGNFSNCGSADADYTAHETLRDIVSQCKVPTLANFPAGHVSDNWA